MFLIVWREICRPLSLNCGGVAQLGEHLICIQKVAGSIPVTSTINICNYLKLLILYGPDFIFAVILAVIFPKTLPKKSILEVIWR